VVDAPNNRCKPVRGSRILILGLAYKRDVGDMRESPSLVLMDLLEARGADVAYHDPYLPVIPSSRGHAHFAGRRSSAISGDYDLFLLATDHSCYDVSLLEHAVPTVDARRVLPEHPLVIRA